MLLKHRICKALLALAFSVSGAAGGQSGQTTTASPESQSARIVQGKFDSGADQAAFQHALAKSFGGEVKISNPDDDPVNDAGGASDWFGFSIALAGDTALVGAYGDDFGAIEGQGSAYVFTRDGTAWRQQARLIAADGAALDRFGRSVALAGDTALIGTPYDDVGTNVNQGSAYVFTRSGTVWIQQGKLIAADGAASDLFGSSVALSGDTALLGAESDDVATNANQGSAYVFTRSGSVWSQQAKLTAADGAGGDSFGKSVALAGDTALVGADADEVNFTNQGSAYVFTRGGTLWSQQAKLTAADGASGDSFGESVALSGDTALVGASGDDIGANLFQGSAYVFTRSANVWSQQAKLTASDGQSSDSFGSSVALSGDTALVGAISDDNGANQNQGSAYVFIRSGSVWSQQAWRTSSDGAANDRFGYSVAISGDTAFMGAYGDDIGANADQGSAYVFTRSANVWSQQAKLIEDDGAAYDFFGSSVALSGDTALVGKPSGSTESNAEYGSAFVFTRNGTTWSQQGKLIAAGGVANDRFGSSVALEGDTAVVGAPENVGTIANQGSAYVFTRSGSVWSQQAKLVAGDGAANDQFGEAVALAGDLALVGSSGDDIGPNFDQGSVYAFTRNGASWSLQAKLTASDGATNDKFGRSVALATNTALVGATGDDIGANQSQGSAYVFSRSGSVWSQQAKLLAGDGAASDLFGKSVALAGDTALVGAYLNDVNFTNQGSAYVFTRSGSVWSQQARLTAVDGAASDSFGESVALAGDIALVGATGNQGSAYVFTRSGTVWSQQTKLTASDGAAADYFGVSVALSADTFLVGAPNDDSAWPSGYLNVGSVYAYVDGYIVTPSVDPNGALSPATPQLIRSGQTTSFTVTPVAGYSVQTVSGCGGNWTGSNPYVTATITANCTVTASFVINTYTLAYAAGANGSITGTSPQFVNHGASASAVSAVPDTGYRFMQWSDSNTNNPRTDTNVSGNISVTAQFMINQYTVSFDSQGGSAVAPITQDYGSTVTVPAAPTRIGYTFASWNTAANGSGINYAPAATFAMSANNQTLYAHWTINTYTLTYAAGANGSISGASQQMVNYSANGSAVSAVPDTGYRFMQWSDSNTNNPRTDTNVSGNISVTAQFVINQYTVSFDSQGGSAVAPITQDYGSTVTVPAAPTRIGYTFASWNTAANGSGINYAPAATFVMPADNWTLHALWTINQYTVSFDSQGGSAVAAITQNFASIVTVPAAPTRTGYTFANWNTDANGSGTSYVLTSTFAMPANNSTLYAQWTINTYTLTYTAGVNGSITGSTSQSVNHGSDGSVVTAVPNVGYRFVDWSDGLMTSSRTDTNVIGNISFTANFSNDAPSISAVGDQSVLEDSGSQSMTVSLTDTETDVAALVLTATSGQTGLIPHPLVGATANPNERSITFAPAAHGNGGPVTISLNVMDAGGASFGRSFTVSVTAVNDAPTLTTGSVASYPAASSGVRSHPDFASVDFGPGDEDASQSVADFLIDSIDDPAGVLVTNSLDIANDDTLGYTLSGISGTATITARVQDSGGIANDGEDTSPAVQFTISVNPGADLEIANDNHRAGLLDGETTVYAIVVANAGPNAVVGARINDVLPNSLINGSWTCVQGASTAACPVPSANPGNLDALIDLGVNQYLRFDVMAEVDGTVGAFVTNTATVSVPNGTTAINTGNDSATDQDPIVPIGLFASGFETAPATLTVPGASEALRAD